MEGKGKLWICPVANECRIVKCMHKDKHEIHSKCQKSNGGYKDPVGVKCPPCIPYGEKGVKPSADEPIHCLRRDDNDGHCSLDGDNCPAKNDNDVNKCMLSERPSNYEELKKADGNGAFIHDKITSRV